MIAGSIFVGGGRSCFYVNTGTWLRWHRNSSRGRSRDRSWGSMWQSTERRAERLWRLPTRVRNKDTRRRLARWWVTSWCAATTDSPSTVWENVFQCPDKIAFRAERMSEDFRSYSKDRGSGFGWIEEKRTLLRCR